LFVLEQHSESSLWMSTVILVGLLSSTNNSGVYLVVVVVPLVLLVLFLLLCMPVGFTACRPCYLEPLCLYCLADWLQPIRKSQIIFMCGWLFLNFLNIWGEGWMIYSYFVCLFFFYVCFLEAVLICLLFLWNYMWSFPPLPFFNTSNIKSNNISLNREDIPLLYFFEITSARRKIKKITPPHKWISTFLNCINAFMLIWQSTRIGVDTKWNSRSWLIIHF